MKDVVKIICSCLLIIFVFIFFIINNDSNLEILKNTKLEDNDRIEKIIKSIDYGNDLKEYNIKNNVLSISYNSEFYQYHFLEKNASILFYLIDNLENINFSIDGTIYNFNYSDISKIYDNFSKIKITSINKRYENEKFDNVYLGNIDGKYDVFDISELCIETYNEFYKKDDYTYYITCASIDEIIISDGENDYYIKEALDKKIIEIDDLLNTNLKITKEGFEKNEDID